MIRSDTLGLCGSVDGVASMQGISQSAKRPLRNGCNGAIGCITEKIPNRTVHHAQRSMRSTSSCVPNSEFRALLVRKEPMDPMEVLELAEAAMPSLPEFDFFAPNCHTLVSASYRLF